MTSLFHKTKDLVLRIDNFIDLIADANLHFNEGVRMYLEKRMDDFNDRVSIITETEKNADSLRKDIETELYLQTLIPESRGDVLGLLESLDYVVDRTKSTIMEFSIEAPDFPESMTDKILELSQSVMKTVDALVFAMRAFFYEINSVKDHLHRVKFFEREADILTENILREIFLMDIDLSKKMHLRYFAKHIDTLADEAEDVANRLSIATIKRIV